MTRLSVLLAALLVALLHGGNATAQEECAAALEHVREVFGTSAAAGAYASLRAAGKSPFESVLGVHESDPAARRALLGCSGEVIAYLDTLVGPPGESAPPIDPNAPREPPGCIQVRWQDDFAIASANPGPARDWGVTATVMNNCRRPIHIALCVVFPSAGVANASQQTQLLDRPLVADYTFRANAAPTNEYYSSYGICEIDETCDLPCGT